MKVLQSHIYCGWLVRCYESHVHYEYSVNEDVDLMLCGELTDMEIMADVMKKRMHGVFSSEEEKPQLGDSDSSSFTVSIYIQDLRWFVEGQHNISDDIFQALDKLGAFTTIQYIKTSKCDKIFLAFLKDCTVCIPYYQNNYVQRIFLIKQIKLY